MSIFIYRNSNFKKNRDYNFQSSANLELSSTNMDTSFQLQYGDNPKNEDKKITLSQSGSNRLRAGKRNSNLKVNLKYPAMVSHVRKTSPPIKLCVFLPEIYFYKETQLDSFKTIAFIFHRRIMIIT